MTAKKAAKKAVKKAPAKQEEQVAEAQTVTEAAGPEMEGEAYQKGYIGVSSDDEDHSVAAQVAKLNDEA